MPLRHFSRIRSMILRIAGAASVQRQALGKASAEKQTHCPQQSIAFPKPIIYLPSAKAEVGFRSVIIFIDSTSCRCRISAIALVL